MPRSDVFDQLLVKNGRGYVRRQGNVVEKKINDQLRYWREVEAQKQLFTFLDGADLGDGWSIVQPRVLWIESSNQIYGMDFISGCTVDYLIRQGAEVPYYFIGAALRTFHDKTQESGGTVKLYGDISRANILIDMNSRSICLLDPGLGYGRQGVRAEDVAVFWASVWIGYLRHRRLAPGKALEHLFDGYVGVHGDASFDLPSGWQDAALKRLREGVRKRQGLARLANIVGSLYWQYSEARRISMLARKYSGASCASA